MIIYISYHNLGISLYTVAATVDSRVVDVLNYQQLLSRWTYGLFILLIN